MASDIKVITSKEEMRAFTRALKREGKTVGFVPTMVRSKHTRAAPAAAPAAADDARRRTPNPRKTQTKKQGYLHDGHLSLVEIAKRECGPNGAVVASVYVNPTQFAAHEDFDVYPRDAEGDRAKLARAGCVAVFEPASLYDYNGSSTSASAVDSSSVVGRTPQGAEPRDAHETFVTVERLQKPLCGGSRPHFFRGVATVVSKLFHIVEPDVAVFGRKDYQQLRVISRMVRDLDMAVRVVGAEISRESDGLAMSSRNARLSAEAREAAPAIYQALKWARDSSASGEVTDPKALRDEVERRVTDAGGKVDYVEVRDAETLEELEKGGGGEGAEGAAAPAAAPVVGKGAKRAAVLAVAAHFPAKDKGTVRLIDNIELEAV
jgi:pantoate--beta-alanine ligase